MATYNRQSVLASFGNLPVAAAGRVLFPVNSSSPNVNAGEIFIESNGVTIGLADIPTATNIKIGIGMGPVNGAATDIRYVAGEEINLCEATIKARTTTPVCGAPQVQDVFINGCINCNEGYSFTINLDDSYVRSNFSMNEKLSYNYTAVASCCDTCGTCNQSGSCDDLVCKFVDQINNRVQTDPTKLTRFVYADMKHQYQPFGAAKLYLQKNNGGANTTRVFCLDPTSTPCENCANLTGITGISIDGVVTPFQVTTMANDNTVSKPSHVKSIVDQINAVLDPLGGHAFYKHGVGKCCSYTIEINSCVNDILLTTSVGTLAACDESNPFTTFTRDNVCRGCNVPASSIAPTCGFRVYTHPLELHCPCDLPPNFNTPNYYGRTIDVQPAGDGWDCEMFFTNESSTQVIPEGLGYYWKDKAYLGNHRGGAGRDFRYNNVHRGRFHLPDDTSRATNAAKGIICDESYCVYNLLTTASQNRFFNNANVNVNTDVDWLLIPSGDIATHASWEPILAALQSRGVCQAGAVNCF